MSLTAEQYRSLVDVQRGLVKRGLSPAAAGQAVLRAVDRVSPGGMGSCGTNCCCCRDGGVGATVPVATAPVAAPSSGAPAILAEISAAGSDPNVSTIRDIVGKWSWLIPVGGLLMSAKKKVSGMVSPTSASTVSLRRR